MKKSLAFSMLLLGVMLASGCAIVHHKADMGSSNKPISYTADIARPYTVVDHFKESRRQIYLLFWLIPVRDANGVEIAEDRAAPVDGVVNLQISSNLELWDGLVTLLTAGLLNTWNVEAEGDLVRFNPPPAGQQPNVIIVQ